MKPTELLPHFKDKALSSLLAVSKEKNKKINFKIEKEQKANKLEKPAV